ncbi:transglycosylase SLT domain-containing protein [Coralliovum pocilloporae]|uniref:transglycosylase SLT domain-containing protein n=1 Tax=Coralliovum pocilloporae TaxID=3066369 RepID=UPI0033075403
METASLPKISDRIESAFRAASETTGTNFDFLLETAKRESNFDPQAKASTSSAAGLFQFIESTWLETLKENGSRLGYGDFADKIAKKSNGKYVVPNRDDREAVLALRFNPEASAKLAGAYAEGNGNYLRKQLDRNPSAGELYIAHFLGPGGGARLIKAADQTPDVRADKLFPEQARANKPIFYHRDGRARDVSEVYRNLVSSYDNVPVRLASAPEETRSVAEAPQQDPRFAGWSAKAPENPFHGLFRDDSPTANLLNTSGWSTAYAEQDRPDRALFAPATPPEAENGRQPLNLLSFLKVQKSV